MKEKRIHVDFQKIIDQHWKYNGFDLLYIYQWLINLGQSCSRQHGWNRYGLHQSFHQYSYNNEPRELYPLDSNYQKTIYDGFVALLCRSRQPEVVQEFLDRENIKLGKVRIIKFKEDGIGNNYYGQLTGNRHYDVVTHLAEAYKGLELKKEFFHPDYENRLRPRIIDNVQFGTNYNRWIIWFNFSFECFDYENGWKYEIMQNENENLESFFHRAVETIDYLLMPSESCDNCPLWLASSYHGDYLRHGYRGGCKLYENCNKPNVTKYKWWVDETGSHDNAIHPSIVFPYHKTK